MALNFPMGNRGQAAITDALYFLLIVSGLSVFLFVFSMNYGNTVTEKMRNESRAEYAASAFKTIFYSSTPRVAGSPLEDTLEVDYLLAAIKEDFASNAPIAAANPGQSKLTRTKVTLANNVAGIMEPIQDSYDYVFYIHHEAYAGSGMSGPAGNDTPFGEGFAFLMFFLRERNIPAGRLVDPNLMTSTAKIYVCDPGTSATRNDIDNLLNQLGSAAHSSSLAQLPVLQPNNLSKQISSQFNLAIWVSTDIPKWKDPLNPSSPEKPYTEFFGCKAWWVNAQNPATKEYEWVKCWNYAPDPNTGVYALTQNTALTQPFQKTACGIP